VRDPVEGTGAEMPAVSSGRRGPVASDSAAWTSNDDIKSNQIEDVEFSLLTPRRESCSS